jgi:hypothetical protein
MIFETVSALNSPDIFQEISFSRAEFGTPKQNGPIKTVFIRHEINNE